MPDSTCITWELTTHNKKNALIIKINMKSKRFNESTNPKTERKDDPIFGSLHVKSWRVRQRRFRTCHYVILLVEPFLCRSVYNVHGLWIFHEKAVLAFVVLMLASPWQICRLCAGCAPLLSWSRGAVLQSCSPSLDEFTIPTSFCRGSGHLRDLNAVTRAEMSIAERKGWPATFTYDRP